MSSRRTSLSRWRLRAGVSVALVAMLSAGLVLARHGSTQSRTIATTDAATAKGGAHSIGFGALTSAANSVASTTTLHPASNLAPTSTTVATPASRAPGGTTPTSVKKARSSGSSSTSPPVAGTPASVTATIVDQRGLYLVDADTGAVKPVLLHYSFETVSFSPDGRRIVFTGRPGDAAANGAVPTQMWTINTDGTGLTPIATDNQYPEDPSWSPDGRSIAYYAYPVDANDDTTLYLLDTATQTHRRLASVDQGRFPLEWSPDSSKIAFASPNHGTISVVDPVTGTKTEAPVAPETGALPGPNPVNQISWTSDGRHLIASYSSGPVMETDALGNRERILNPNGRFAEASPTAAVVSEWVDFSAYLQPLDGSPARLVTAGFDPLDWSPDGQLIAAESSGNTAVAIDVTTGLMRQLIHADNLGVSPAGWSPVGHSFAVVVEDASGRRY
jgi:Tol biopolymer transport system component